jgi:uncharacterized protein
MGTLRNPGLAVLALLAALTLVAAAQTFPQLTGRVVDEAGVLDPPVRAAIDSDLADLETRTTDQLVVVTVRSLQGLTIEDYGVRLGRQWGIGQKDKNNGALLIVAPKDRKVRIEIGYGLEGVLTDAQTKLIIENTIIPRFRANDMAGGIARGVDEIIRLLDGDAWQGGAAPAQPTAFTRTTGVLARTFSWIPGDIVVLIALFLLACGFSLLSVFWLWLLLPLMLHIGVWVGLVSRDRLRLLAQRQAKWHFFGWYTAIASTSSSGSSWSSSSSGSSWSGGGFSGGGGSFGGGGASGSW